MKTTINQQQFKRVIAIADIHARIDLLKQMVQEVIQVKQTDCLIFLGDYIDFRVTDRAVRKGSISSAWVVEYLTELRKHYPEQIVLCKGNHELMAERYFQGNESFDFVLWQGNGGDETVASYGGVETAGKVLIPFIQSLSLYAESDDHVFLHGCIPPGETIESASEEELLYSTNFEIYRGNKTLVVGHAIHQDITFYSKAIALDTGAFRSGRLTGYDVLNQKVYEAVV